MFENEALLFVVSWPMAKTPPSLMRRKLNGVLRSRRRGCMFGDDDLHPVV